MNAITETFYGGVDGIKTKAEVYTGQVSLNGASIPPLSLDPEMTTYVGTPHNAAVAFLTENPDRTLQNGITMRSVLEERGFDVHKKRYGDDHYILITPERSGEFTITDNGFAEATQGVWNDCFNQLTSASIGFEPTS